MSKTMIAFCAAYTIVGAICFGIYAHFSPPKDEFTVVKVRQVPPMIPKPIEVKRP